MSFVFISYSRQDLNYVSQLVQALEAKGLPFWLDEKIEHSANWPRVIEQQLNECQVFLLVMTPQSYDSHWVQCELARAIELRKPIFPLLLEGTRWFSVTALQFRDVTNGELPPNNFFTDIGRHFPKAPTTSQTFSIPDAADWRLPEPPPSSIVLPSDKPLPKSADFLEDDLASDKGIDYTQLRDLLKANKWKEADNDTHLRMLEIVGRIKGDWIRSDDLPNFPCTDLKTIDRLWVKYSNGRFGFSVQREIYGLCSAKLNGKYPGDRIWEEFCERVGWIMNGFYIGYSDVVFSTSAPYGHLPFSCSVARLVGCLERTVGQDFFFRIQTCKL